MNERLKFDLRGRTALVTGGASGIGLAAVRLLARSGARVAVNYLPDDPAAAGILATLRTEGLDVLDAPVDVGAGYAVVQTMVNSACSRLGRLDYLINNAAIFGSAPIPHANLDELNDEMWERILNINLVGAFRCVRAARAYLVDARGAIVNVSSVAGFHRPGSSIPYGAAKAGVVKLTIDLARALAPHVRVNTVAPGLTRSPWTDSWPTERLRTSISRLLLGNIIEPEEIAAGIVFLLAGTNCMTGQALILDGGISIS